jgi:hypothetical protein
MTLAEHLAEARYWFFVSTATVLALAVLSEPLAYLKRSLGLLS